MKNLLLIFFLLQSTSALLAQQTVFLPDSLSPNGIVLSEGWKFHAGDNPKWAKSDFDDSKWESIDPTMDLGDLPQTRKEAIGWFRIRFKVDSSLINKPLAFQVYQSIASEIYLNGKLLKKYGIVSSKGQEAVGFQPHNEPEGILFSSTEQTLAVRFSVQPNLPYFFYIRPYRVLEFRFNTVYDSIYVKNFETRHFGLNCFEAGLFLLLALIHLIFFINYPKQKANLYLALSTFSIGIGHLFFGFILASNSLAFKAYASSIDYPLIMPIYGVFLYLTIWDLFSQKRTFYFWFLLTYTVVGSLTFTFHYQSGYLWGLVFPLFLCHLESLRISYGAFRQKQSGVGVIIIGLITYFFLFSWFMLIVLQLLPDQHVIHTYNLMDVLYNASLFCAPISFSIFLSRKFANTSKALESKLVEVQRLSEEKQVNLLQQNAELQAALLQGQTTERKRVAADLHDNLGTSLSALRWNLEAINSKNLNKNEQEAYRNLHFMIDKAYNEVRLLSHNLLPEDLEKQGLRAALQSFVRKINQNTSLKFTLFFPENFPRLSPKTEFELYSICLELINNILKHAQATEASVRFEVESGKLRLMLSDNGKGLFENGSTGKGLRNIAERVKSLGGTWEVKSEEGLGVVNVIMVNVNY
jgi:signal transduction histidine kinase